MKALRIVDYPHDAGGDGPKYHPHAEAERRLLLADHDDDASDARDHPRSARFERRRRCVEGRA